MESRQEEALGPELEEAKETLSEALQEACRADVVRADTGELIRIEEVLAIAGDAAKRAVSIRRKLGRKSRRRDTPPPTSLADTAAASELEVEPTGDHRYFDDAEGHRWDVFAVHPSRDVAGRAQLPEPYRQGWLSFDRGSEKRRLSPIPEGWESLTEDELRALCDQAEAVRISRGSRLPPPERPDQP